ncbi:ester cyclase [Gymnodinialimonas sp. 2305UL16-5]|uniref:ester cyclase n=1 Tax=Gymnodinialimonas mytili TaxID=3126503 RepID=UPI0030993E9A
MTEKISSAKRALSGIGTRFALSDIASPDCVVRLAHPFETMDVSAYEAQALGALARAFPDLERRVTIEIAGQDARGELWVGQAGYYCGVFDQHFLDIPPTRRMAAMRFHDFFQVDSEKVIQMQSLWDLPEVMMQAGVWPLSPSLGREWQVPGPATQDGLRVSGDGVAAVAIVDEMLGALGNDPSGTPSDVMARYWHSHCSWYGPAGIGTCRGIEGFRRHHQAPFLGGMPDRVGLIDQGHLFGEGNYVGFTAWPGMALTLSGGTWLGLPGAGQKLDMRSLDFWRIEDGRIAENWVLVDLLHVYHQLGTDVLARMKEIAN